MAGLKQLKPTTASKARLPLSGVPIDVTKVIELIHKHRGVVAYVAESIGCCRKTIHDLVERHPEVRQALDEARERLIDLVEETFIDKAIKGDSYNAAFVLKTRGRNRGYDFDAKEVTDTLKQVLGFVMNKSKTPVNPTLD
jgi:hypothetical protein